MNPEERERIAEKFLDAALKQYSAAEPRPGLETRILANLASARKPKPSLLGFPRAAWLAAAALVLLAVSVGVLRHRREPIQVRTVTPLTAPLPQPQEFASAAKPARPVVTRPAVKVVEASQHQRPAAPPATPRLDRFPRPAPLSEQDRLLLAYVDNTPRAEILATTARLTAEREADLKRFLTNPAPTESVGTAQ
jgi:hypothetical protein